jgi:polysaccharide pyruvyl transferase WcaK-like protein
MIVFSGYYGFQNFGDDLFPMACAKASASVFMGKKIAFLAPPIAGVNGKFLVPAFLATWYRSRLWGRPLRFLFLIYGLILADYFVLAGGSTLGTRTSMRLRETELIFARFGWTKIGAIGVSVGPFHNVQDEDFFKEYLEKLKFLIVRDIASVERARGLLPNIDVVSSVDLVGWLRPEIAQAERSISAAGELLIGISVCNYKRITESDNEVFNSRWQCVKDAIAILCSERPCKVLVISLNGNQFNGDDRYSQKLCEELFSVGCNVEIRKYRNPWDVVQSIKSLDVLLTYRLHGAIVSYLAGTPFVLIEYHEKCRDFLDAIGSSEGSRIGADESTEHLLSCMKHVINSGKQIVKVDPLTYENMIIESFSSLVRL